MVGRGELTEKAWASIAPLLPTRGRRGRQFDDHRVEPIHCLFAFLTTGEAGPTRIFSGSRGNERSDL